MSAYLRRVHVVNSMLLNVSAFFILFINHCLIQEVSSILVSMVGSLEFATLVNSSYTVFKYK